MTPLQLWGGIECTLNRVGDRFVDQCAKNGHYERLSDLKLIADLGIKKIRYPCLWERVAPESLDNCDWTFLDERLEEIRRLGVTPIAGFLHHGSGPKYTSLVDRHFPEKLARYAREFASRYPWVTDYTPINEINTTARFSCLYGHWYPHQKNLYHFHQAVILQCKATVLAMREIRKINPDAKLIQTDDLGRCQSTEVLSYQRDYENERRWMAWDFLCGKVTREHPLFSKLVESGITEGEVLWFQENNCPPDVIGINHYHLSNRFLDDLMHFYPEWTHGGNGIHKYADVGAVDTGRSELPTPESILTEVWERYHLPIAVTEVHTRGHRESQIRWLKQMWDAANTIREEGADVFAVTVWSLLGTYDWHKLCTECENFYESGVFNLNNPQKIPQPTALARLVKELALEGKSAYPLLNQDGYWKTTRRILWATMEGAFTSLEFHSDHRPILISGGTGTLGQALARTAGARNIPYVLLRRSQMDITDINSIRKAIELYRPWAIINAAGYVRVDEAEEDSDRCFRENVDGPVNLARVCKDFGLPLVTYSSDLVFDGLKEEAYLESHAVAPISVYGKSKAISEEKVLGIHPQSLIIRTSSFFGPWDEYNFVTLTLRHLSQEKEFSAIDDVIVTPTYVPDLADETLNLLIDGVSGIIHLTNKDEVTWAQLAHRAATAFKRLRPIDDRLIKKVSLRDLSLRARRPKYSALRSERHEGLPPLDMALSRYIDELQITI